METRARSKLSPTSKESAMLGKSDISQASLVRSESSEMKEKKHAKLSDIKGRILIYIIPIIFIVAVLAIYSLYLPHETYRCNEPCVFSLVETIPKDLIFSKNETIHQSIGKALVELIQGADTSIEIASYYWTLRGKDVSYYDDSSKLGEEIFENLQNAGKRVKIRIVQNEPDKNMPNSDTQILAEAGLAEVRSLDMTRLMGGGILHTKFWLVDKRHFYIGSANLDWRSMSQVKELGVLVRNCTCLSSDVSKLFDVYWYLAEKNAVIPHKWPHSYSTLYNKDTPLTVTFNGTEAPVYLSSSPASFCPDGRISDIDAIENVIYSAEKFVYISVMDYFPRTIYAKHNEYWPTIDDALRKMAYDNHTEVRLLVGWWKHTIPDMPVYLYSLQALALSKVFKIEVRMFVVPNYTESEGKIPFGRVNHCKYMVTDKHAYIGTSNWSQDYFNNTGGVGFIVQQNKSDNNGNFRQQLEEVFLRDWKSEFAKPLTAFIKM